MVNNININAVDSYTDRFLDGPHVSVGCKWGIFLKFYMTSLFYIVKIKFKFFIELEVKSEG
jgi:hypothetical protein